MKKILYCLILLLSLNSSHAQSLRDKLNKAKTTLVTTPSNEEIVQGLKEALNVGANKSSSTASQVDGYFKNPRLFIPFPQEAEKMKTQLVKLGFQKQVTDFETSLNRAAEEAAKKSTPIFMEAVKNMSVTDGMNVLMGADTAATHYLKSATSAGLYAQYKPVVQEAIKKVEVTRYWNTLVTLYNRVPGVKKQNPNIEDYVIKRGLSGLFLLVSDQEQKIRTDPAARFSSVLKNVFGYADVQKK